MNYALLLGVAIGASLLIHNAYGQEADLGQATSGGRNYVGLAGAIGLHTNDSEFGSAQLALYSKIGLADVISVRPAFIMGSSGGILIPVTYDYVYRDSKEGDLIVGMSPYLGAGATFRRYEDGWKTNDDWRVAFSINGGIDLILSPQFVATASANLALFANPDIDFMLGLAYNFSNF